MQIRRLLAPISALLATLALAGAAMLPAATASAASPSAHPSCSRGLNVVDGQPACVLDLATSGIQPITVPDGSITFVHFAGPNEMLAQMQDSQLVQGSQQIALPATTQSPDAVAQYVKMQTADASGNVPSALHLIVLVGPAGEGDGTAVQQATGVPTVDLVAPVPGAILGPLEELGVAAAVEASDNGSEPKATTAYRIGSTIYVTGVGLEDAYVSEYSFANDNSTVGNPTFQDGNIMVLPVTGVVPRVEVSVGNSVIGILSVTSLR